MDKRAYRYKSNRDWERIAQDADDRPNEWIWIGWFSRKFNPSSYAAKYGLTLEILPAKNAENDFIEVWAAKIVEK